MQVTDILSQNPFFLAPMAGITDRPFRSFMRELGCGVVTTELVSANGLKYNSEKTRRIMSFNEDQHPVGVQIFGETPEIMTLAAQEAEQMGADFVDLNLGCPVSKVVKKGAGSALLKDLPRLAQVIRTIQAAIQIPITIKIRTGWTQETRNSPEVVQLAYDEGVAWVAIHGRTRVQAYTGKADWDYISFVAENSKVPIIGNGDIVTPTAAVDHLKNYKCGGVMIGRGCLKNPWIFSQAQNLRTHQEGHHPQEDFSDNSKSINKNQDGVAANHLLSDEKDFQALFKRLSSHLERHFEERIAMIQFKKLAVWYSSGYPHSANFRSDVFQIKNRSELYRRVDEYYDELKTYQQKDTSREAFLMSGHG